MAELGGERDAPRARGVMNEIDREPGSTDPLDRAELGARERDAFVVEAGHVLASSLDFALTLQRVAELAVPRIADWCTVELVDEQGTTDQLAMMHPKPEKVEMARALRRRYPPAPNAAWGILQVIRSRRPLVMPELDDALLTDIAQDDVHLRLLRQLGMRSLMMVPMIARGRALGAITFVSTESDRRFGEIDLEMAERLAQSAAMAIDNARLFAAERAAREAAERSTARLARLQTVIRELTAAPDSERIAEVSVQHGVEAVGALTGGLWLLEPGADHLQLLRSNGFPERALERYSRMSLNQVAPLVDCVLRRTPVFTESQDDFAQRYAESEARSRDVMPTEIQSMACLPLLVGDTALGALAFTFRGPRRFEQDERRFLIVLADHAALALQRAALYEVERRSRAETELLYDLVGAANRAAHPEVVYDLALDAIGRALSVERSAILLFDDDGVMRFKAWRRLSEAYRRAVEGHSPWPRDVRRPEPVQFADAQSEPSLARFSAVLSAENVRAMAFIPLVAEERLLGKLMVYLPTPRTLADEELRLARAIANRVAEAVARKQDELEIARLYSEAQVARGVAEHAARSREHLLAIVAHDLRNLLHAAELRSGLAMRRVKEERSPEWLQEELAEILDSTRGMSRLVDDLLDAAAIDAGRLSVAKRKHELEGLLEAAVETARLLASDRNVEVRAELRAEDAELVCDRERVLQVIANLIGNAVKFSPKGGTVQLDARVADGSLQLCVRDAGPGIPPEVVARVFERYFKGEPNQSGVGLGLYIARGLVDAHGGRIWIESTPGAGTSVFVTLPLSG